MKKLFFSILLIGVVSIGNAQKLTERELVLEVVAKLQLFNNSAKNIQALYLYEAQNEEETRKKELASLDKLLPCITKAVNNLKTNYPNSAKTKALKTNVDVAKKMLESLKFDDWESESNMVWQLMISLISMDLEDRALNNCK